MLLYEKDIDLRHMKFMFEEMKKEYDLQLSGLMEKVEFLMQRNELVVVEETETLKLKNNKLEEDIKDREEVSKIYQKTTEELTSHRMKKPLEGGT